MVGVERDLLPNLRYGTTTNTSTSRRSRNSS